MKGGKEVGRVEKRSFLKQTKSGDEGREWLTEAHKKRLEEIIEDMEKEVERETEEAEKKKKEEEELSDLNRQFVPEEEGEAAGSLGGQNEEFIEVKY